MFHAVVIDGFCFVLKRFLGSGAESAPRSRVDAEVRSQIMKSDYSVTSFYHDEGRCQRVARSKIFDTVVLVVILLNSIWSALGLDPARATAFPHRMWSRRLAQICDSGLETQKHLAVACADKGIHGHCP